MRFLRSLPGILKQTFAEWKDDEVPRLAAALAYYTSFALAPTLVIVIAVAGLVFGAENVRTEIVAQAAGMLGDAGGELVGAAVEAASRPKEGWLAVALGLMALLFAASGLFGELQSALNTVWEVEPKPGRGLLGLLRDRFLSFTMVLGVGFLLLVSLVLSAGLAGAEKYAAGHLAALAPVLHVAGFVVGFGVTTLLFAMIYKFLPDVELRWRDVWTGALATAFFFSLGRFLIGLYLGRSTVGSAYGAAGSLAIILAWVYYSSQVLLFGAEFTQVYARRRGTWAEPKEDAQSTRPEDAPAGKERAPQPEPPEAEDTPVAAAVMLPEPGESERERVYASGMALGALTAFLGERIARAWRRRR
jgi:membrane protein